MGFLELPDLLLRAAEDVERLIDSPPKEPFLFDLLDYLPAD